LGLAHFGAEVTKIEDPRKDEPRTIGILAGTFQQTPRN
jgi:crotonobetainyl-CoA:carnitine CoA-transferase CaiB-like acyl-CoA transferase